MWLHSCSSNLGSKATKPESCDSGFFTLKKEITYGIVNRYNQ